MLLVWFKFLPVRDVLVQVNFIYSPEASEMLLVEIVDRVIVDREQHESLIVVSEDRLLLVGALEVLTVRQGVVKGSRYLHILAVSLGKYYWGADAGFVI